MWSGDILAGFDGIRRQNVRMLSTVSLGEAKWGMDSGGFVGDPDRRTRPLAPVQRPGADLPRPRRSSQAAPAVALDSIMAEEVAKNAIQLRYRLATYVYGCDRQCYESGVGLVRPLMMEFPQDFNSANVTDEWMFGDWLLAAPCCASRFPRRAASASAGRSTCRRGNGSTISAATSKKGGRKIKYAINPGVWTDIRCSSAAGP